MARARALKAMKLQPTDRIPHWESFSNPDFEKVVTGIDPWQHPQQARQRLLELLPMDVVSSVPVSDAPLECLPDDQLTFVDSNGARSARWGAGRTWRWNWGQNFRSIDDVLAYAPIEHMDQRYAGVVAEYDYGLSIDDLAQVLQSELDQQRATAGERALVTASFYNALFM